VAAPRPQGGPQVIIALPPIDAAQAALGQRLRRVRQARGFTGAALAAACDLTPSRLGLAEQGRTRLTSVELHALTTALHVPIAFLMAERLELDRLRPL
jgi:transcriptional regulator with XRE-family HTH domain